MKASLPIPILFVCLTTACLFLHSEARPQVSDTIKAINFPLTYEDFSIYDFASVRLEKDKTEKPPADIISRKFQPVKEIFQTDEMDFSDSIKSFWIKFTIVNSSPSDTTVALVFPGHVSKAVLYKEEDDRLQLIGKTGFFIAVLARNVSYHENRIDLVLKARSKVNYFIQVILYHGIWMPKMPVIETFPYAEMMAFQNARQVKRLNLLWSHFFTGVFFMFFVFGFIKYLMLGRDKAYLYYSLMGFFCALLTFAQAEDPPLELPWFENIRGVEWFDLLSAVAFIMQGLFILEILQFKIKYPRITLAIKWYFLLKFLLYLSNKIIFFTSREDSIFGRMTLYDVIFFHLLLLCWVVYLATIRKGFFRFIFLGALTIFIAYTLMFTVAFFQLHYLLPIWFNTDPRASVYHFISIALVIDMCFYFTGLAYRDRQVQEDKILYQEQLKLTKIESERTKAELQQQATELEMQALRAQMNPHFIFNSLNSINRFILQNNRLQASEYLTKFSKLIRLILQNSQAPLITLESELESLQLYLELESVRFDHHFEFKIIVKEDLETDVINVPPLIIQPFTENAIWHGLMNKKEKGHLEIELFEENNLLCCKITDDGIGRKKAAEIKSKSATTHKSMGMQITANRINMLQQKKQLDSNIKITDLILADGSAGGTQVLMKIPFIE